MANPFDTLVNWIEENEQQTRSRRESNVVDLVNEGFKLVADAIDSRYKERKETYGSLNTTGSDSSSKESPSSVTVTNGTIDSGDITSVQAIDGSELVVSESGKFEIAFTFSTMGGDPATVEVYGRYQGNAAHDVFIEAYNYDTSTWDRLTAAAQDFPNGTVDESYVFSFPGDSSDYLDTAETQVRIRHDSNAVGTHHFYTDYISIFSKFLDMPVVGTKYQITGFTEGEFNNITLDGALGTQTILYDGVYDLFIASSFGGLTGADVHIHVWKDGTERLENVGFSRQNSANGAMGNASSGDLVHLQSGDVLGVYAVCDNLSDCYLSIDHFAWKAVQLVGPELADGDLVSQVATMAGAASKVSVAAGSLVSEVSTFSGVAIVSQALGQGVLEAEVSISAGAAVRVVIAEGSLQADGVEMSTDVKGGYARLYALNATADGEGVRTVFAAGGMSAENSIMAGEAVAA